MQMIRHDPPGVPPALGGYTNGFEVRGGDRMLFISGQIPQRPDGTVPDTIEGQCRLVWGNVLATLLAADMSVPNLVKVTTFLSHRDLAETNSAVRREVLGSHRPALTVVIAEIFDPQWLLEIEALAVA